jgi:soluble lytic murein transglycosylase-like protein
MDSTRPARWMALAGLLAAPLAAWPGEPAYRCENKVKIDDEEVLYLTNVPTDPNCRQVRRTSEVAGLYRAPAPAHRGVVARAIPASERSAPYAAHVKSAAAKYKLQEALIWAVMAVESNFEPRARSDKGAMGLMQLMPATAKELYVEDAFDPAQNIEGGSRYLRILANQYAGDMVKTLAAYNAGPEAVRRAGEGVPDIPETREYVQKVTQLYQAYKAGR